MGNSSTILLGVHPDAQPKLERNSLKDQAKELLRDYIDLHQVQVLNFVPTLLSDLLVRGRKLVSLRFVLSGGEPLVDAIKDSIIQRGYRLYNQYGPTETTIDALVGECGPGKVTLGSPIANVNCYLLEPGAYCRGGGIICWGCRRRKGVFEQPRVNRGKVLPLAARGLFL